MLRKFVAWYARQLQKDNERTGIPNWIWCLIFGGLVCIGSAVMLPDVIKWLHGASLDQPNDWGGTRNGRPIVVPIRTNLLSFAFLTIAALMFIVPALLLRNYPTENESEG